MRKKAKPIDFYFVTKKINSFIFLQNRISCTLYFLVNPIFLDHFVVSFVQFNYIVFTAMFYPSYVLFFKFLFSNTEKKCCTVFCTVLLYRKFSYLVQFYSFTLAILLYHFSYLNVYPPHGQFISFPPLYFL